MRVAIIGAGISGLAAARELLNSNHNPVIFEKSQGVGGRVNTRADRGSSFVWDTGATSVAPRGKKIESVILNELPTEDLIEITKPIYTHSGLRTQPGQKNAKRYTYSKGLQLLPKMLAESMDIRFNESIADITIIDEKYRIAEESFDALILTAPIPQTAQILWSLGESRPLANARYRSCISVLLGFDAPNPDVPYHAILDIDQVHPLTWLSIESLKSPGRAEDDKCAMVAQLSPRFSQENYSKSDEFIINAVKSFTQTLYGAEFSNPSVAMVKKWKYSQPEGLARFETVNQPGSRLLIASDGIMGGRIEDAYECGVKVAELLNHA
jgi:renalase